LSKFISAQHYISAQKNQKRVYNTLLLLLLKSFSDNTAKI